MASSETCVSQTRATVNRGVNFFAVAALGILATTPIHGLQLASVWIAAIDDVAGLVVAAAAAGWYLAGQNRYQRSILPLVFLILALTAQLTGMWLVFGSLVLGGPDFGVAILPAEALVVSTWQFQTTK